MVYFIIAIFLFVQVIRTQDAQGVITEYTPEFTVNQENSNFLFPVGEEIGQPAPDLIDNNTLNNINNFTGSPPQNSNTSLGGTSDKIVGNAPVGNDTHSSPVQGNYTDQTLAIIGDTDDRSPAIAKDSPSPIPSPDFAPFTSPPPPPQVNTPPQGSTSPNPSPDFAPFSSPPPPPQVNTPSQDSTSSNPSPDFTPFISPPPPPQVNISPQDNTSPNPPPDFVPFTSPPPSQGSVSGLSSQDLIVEPQDGYNFEYDQSYTNDNPSSQEIIPQEQFNATEAQIQPFISNVLLESKLGAILPRQLTPSKDDVNTCLTFWTQQPQGYDGTQITHCYPLSAVGRLQIFFEGISEPATCTGAVIGAHTVLTAAHCFILETTNIEFTPGQFADYKPFGSFQNGVVYKSEKFSWSDASNDYAVVKFSEDIGALTGWLGVEYGGCDSQRGYDLMVAGFADDRSDQMWTAECADTFVDPCANGDQSGTFRHECDTNGGTSGAPLMENNLIVGVHSGYINAVDKNTATYISRELMDFIDTHTS